MSSRFAKFVLVLPLLTAAFLSPSSAKASTSLADTIVDCPSSPTAFASWFFSKDLPFVKSGHELWDYVITPASGDIDYNVAFYSMDSGVFISGDGVTGAYATVGAGYKGYGYAHDVSTGHCYLNGPNDTFSTYYGSSIALSAPVLASSEDVYYVSTCATNWASTEQRSDGETFLCGSWDSHSGDGSALTACNAVLHAGQSSSCTSTPPPIPAPVVQSCTSTFANIPSIIDSPTGFISGVWTGISDWFTCIFGNVISTLISSLGSWLYNMVIRRRIRFLRKCQICKIRYIRNFQTSQRFLLKFHRVDLRSRIRLFVLQPPCISVPGMFI